MPYVPPPGAGVGDGFNIVSAGTQLAGTNTTVLFSNANNVSFGMSNNSVITASASMPAGVGDGYNILGVNGAGTSASTTLQLSNSNNVSFGLNAGTITASASYPAQTVQTQNLHNVSLSGNTAGVMAQISSGTMYLAGGNNVTLSQNANSVTISGPSLAAYLTTARASNDAIGLNTAATNVTWTVNSSGLSLNAGGYAGTGFTSASTAGSDIAATHGTNGLSVGMPKYLTTAQPVGAYLTTARASNDAIGLNTALTGNGVAMTANSSGLSLNIPAFLTTAAQSGHSHGNPTLALTNLSGTTASASNGLTLSLSAAAPGAGGGAAIKGSGTYTQNTGTVEFGNSNGITFGLSNNGTMTASHNGLTTAMASNANTSFVNATAAFAGTNASGTIASNGISVSVAAPGGGAAPTASASNGSFTFNTIGFSNANNVTFGTSAGSIITASVNAGAGATPTIGRYQNMDRGTSTLLGITHGSLLFQRLNQENDLFAGNITANTFLINMSGTASTGASSTQTIAANTTTLMIGIYGTNATNASVLTLLNSASTTFGSNATFSIYPRAYGNRWLSIHSSNWSSSPVFTYGGDYVFAVGALTAGASTALSYLGQNYMNSQVRSGYWGVSTTTGNTSQYAHGNLWNGVYSATTNAMPASVSQNALNRANAAAIFMPHIMMHTQGQW